MAAPGRPAATQEGAARRSRCERTTGATAVATRQEPDHDRGVGCARRRQCERRQHRETDDDPGDDDHELPPLGQGRPAGALGAEQGSTERAGQERAAGGDEPGIEAAEGELGRRDGEREDEDAGRRPTPVQRPRCRRVTLSALEAVTLPSSPMLPEQHPRKKGRGATAHGSPAGGPRAAHRESARSSARELARRFRASPVTVAGAHARLAAEGLTVARPGHGTFVAEQRQPSAEPVDLGWQSVALGSAGVDARGLEELLAPVRGDDIALTGGFPGESLLPVKAPRGRGQPGGARAPGRLGTAARGGDSRAAGLVCARGGWRDRGRRRCDHVGSQSALATIFRALG